MNHKYATRAYQPSKAFTEEICACGAMRRTSIGGVRWFLHPDGHWKKTSTKCPLQAVNPRKPKKQ